MTEPVLIAILSAGTITGLFKIIEQIISPWLNRDGNKLAADRFSLEREAALNKAGNDMRDELREELETVKNERESERERTARERLRADTAEERIRKILSRCSRDCDRAPDALIQISPISPPQPDQQTPTD